MSGNKSAAAMPPMNTARCHGRFKMISPCDAFSAGYAVLIGFFAVCTISAIQLSAALVRGNPLALHLLLKRDSSIFRAPNKAKLRFIHTRTKTSHGLEEKPRNRLAAGPLANQLSSCALEK